MANKILIIDDDVNICELLRLYIEKEGYETKIVNEGIEAVKAVTEYNPSLVLLDIMLPEEDGLSILGKLQADSNTSNIPVIMITAKGSEFDKVTGLDMGADDYIAKPFGMTELTSRVRAVLRRYEKTNKSKEYRIGDLYVNPEKHIIEVAGKEVTLSFKEYSLLMVLLEAEGNVVSRDALLTRVWGEFYDESRTLDVHIRKLRMKLENAGELIHTVKNIGYKLGGNENG